MNSKKVSILESKVNYVINENKKTSSINSQLQILESKVNYLINENKKIFSMFRNIQNDFSKPYENFSITWDAFNRQWDEVEIPDINNHMNLCTNLMLQWTKLPRSWFKNKKVLDAGCGIGRFSNGFLECGADLKSIDLSDYGVEKTIVNCKKYNHTNVHKVNLLQYKNEDDKEKFDFVWSYGVCHHTGNTKLALSNIFDKVKKGGKIFLMLYGFPRNITEYNELNNYEMLRSEMMLISDDKKIDYLKKRLIKLFPSKLGNMTPEQYYNTNAGKMFLHGWNDAVTPTINELLSYEEVFSILKNNGFTNITRCNDNRNIHVTANKIE